LKLEEWPKGQVILQGIFEPIRAEAKKHWSIRSVGSIRDVLLAAMTCKPYAIIQM